MKRCLTGHRLSIVKMLVFPDRSMIQYAGFFAMDMFKKIYVIVFTSLLYVICPFGWMELLTAVIRVTHGGSFLGVYF